MSLSLCVYCGSRNGLDPAHLAAAREVGRQIGLRGWRLVYGGGSTGLMGAVADALATLNEEFGELFANLAFISDKVEEAESAERKRLAPLIAEAGRRVLEGTTRLANIPSEITYIESVVGAARVKYETAGLSAAEIAGLTQKLTDENAQRSADLREEQTRLAAEVETLGEFLRTRDESALPEDFAPRPAVHGVTYRPAVAHHG